LDPEAIKALIASAKCQEIPKTKAKMALDAVRSCLTCLHHAMELIKAIATILDYLFLDSYEFEAIFEMFANKQDLLKTVVSLITDYEKLQLLRISYASKSSQMSSDLLNSSQTLQIPFAFSKVLFKMVTN
jgi:hypothetical protein